MKNSFGYVFSIKDSIAQVVGLDSVTSGEIVTVGEGHSGIVLNLEKTWTGVVMFFDVDIRSGDKVYRKFHTLRVLSDPIFSFGKVLNLFGDIANKLKLFFFNGNVLNQSMCSKVYRGVELKAPGIIVRQPVYETVYTGILGIDGVLPLGQGQRELIIGDKQTGKTAIAVDVILNQSFIDLLSTRYLLV